MYAVAPTVATPVKTSNYATDQAPTTYYTSLSTIAVTEYAVAAGINYNLNSATFTSIDAWCTYTPASGPNRASLIVTAQAQTSFTYSIGTAATFPITAYQASAACGAPSLVFTYTGYKPDTTAIESVFSVSSTNGAITAANTATLGIF